MKRLNPGELEIDLFCKGIRIDSSCTIGDDGRLFARTRAGLGSGLELVIPGDLKDIWLNVPVEEDFAQQSPYLLIKHIKEYILCDNRNGFEYRVTIPPEPAWYKRKTSSGASMYRIGVLQGTYLGIYINNSCSYWFHEPALNCRFCTSGYNVGVNEEAQKRIQDVVETALAAKEESNVTFLHINSGFQNDKDLDLSGPYVKAIKEKVGLLVGIQMVPTPNLWKYDWLIDLGVNHFSFCYEFHNPDYFARLCPGKEKTLGQKAFFKALEYTVNRLGTGSCSGEIIAGVEPLEDTIKAIDYITDIGAFPTVCIFRPVIGSDMENYPSPRYEDMVDIMRYMYETCRKKGIPIGIAPNIEVSLIVQPDDGRYLVPRNPGFYWNEWMLKWKKIMAYQLFFKKELRPKQFRQTTEIRRSTGRIGPIIPTTARWRFASLAMKISLCSLKEEPMELQTALQPLSKIHYFVKFPILNTLFATMEEQGFISARPCVDGVEFRFLNEVHGLPNRCYLRVYFPNDSKCVLFFHKKSSVPFSHDRFSYGGIVMDVRSTDRFDVDDVQEWVLFLKNGMAPNFRPRTLKKSIPYTIPED